MTALLLDTHAWIWLASAEPRLVAHERLLTRAANASELLLSASSVYEATIIGLESETGRRAGRRAVRMLPTVEQWIRDAIIGTRVVSIALDSNAAMNAALLQLMHSDPFDRLIVAAALTSGARLATADEKMIALGRRSGLSVLEL